MSAFAAKLPWLKKQGVTLMLFSAFLLTSLLVWQQQQIIESQRKLIHQLFRDSMELTQMKVKSAVRSHQDSLRR
ncbi:MAG TPA: hypothetical protein VN577_18175 [Terriglobales bacterium]|nr:hypothetical protein [Terriglobales bacterium]